jgi:hypothetical protein
MQEIIAWTCIKISLAKVLVEGIGRLEGSIFRPLTGDFTLYMANCHSRGDWQFKQSVAMALPKVILKAS